MKLTNPAAIKFVSLLASWLIRAWLGTLDIRFALDEPQLNPRLMKRKGVYLFWHEAILFPAYTHAREGFATLVSEHRDGELITQVLRMLRGEAIRGSTTRGGSKAMLKMLRNRRMRHLGITPDGPRGPRRVMQAGPVYLASRSRRPLIPVGFAACDCWRAPSWDRMILPRPWRQARCVAGRAIEVPQDLDRDALEVWRQKVQTAMD
ncbi:MAG: lysophospholipid acyltransferase family protein, partial [Planctomycetes bacterium]|nr:lysophospholipid acyltransferase family protein [Planctomycetota bacterium]